ncbi:NIPSNAP family protein [Peribacillus kribbensis]|uniref:NIPSNAP family protein n=1 Tax=Peribacillus kribbensis TaxID=356658 RepID=UPI0004196172|nr:NIPSNAP family protein [Peribacillus kribbensis]
MFYRKKYYLVKNEFVQILNDHFTETNLPNQIRCGARLTGRWMVQRDETLTEVFAIWEYDSYEKYIEIEERVRSNPEHNEKIRKWYEINGGREHVYKEYFLEVRNEEIKSTVDLSTSREQ